MVLVCDSVIQKSGQRLGVERRFKNQNVLNMEPVCDNVVKIEDGSKIKGRGYRIRKHLLRLNDYIWY